MSLLVFRLIGVAVGANIPVIWNALTAIAANDGGHVQLLSHSIHERYH